MIQAGQIIVLPAYLYVQTTSYQFRLTSSFKMQVSRADGMGYQSKSFNFEKNYSLAPQQSISFTNRIKVVDILDKKIAYVEACLKNHMDISIGFEKLECVGNKKVKFLQLIGAEKKELELPKDTCLKLIAQYEIDSNYVRFEEFGGKTFID